MKSKAAGDDAELTAVAGEIIKVESDDAVAADFYIDSPRGVVRARGYAVMPFVGVNVKAVGEIEGGRSRGPMLWLETAACELPVTPTEQIIFLSSAFGDVIDQTLAHQLVVAFGPKLVNVLDFEPDELRRVVSEDRYVAIKQRWQVMREAHLVESHLQSIGLNPSLAKGTILALRTIGIDANFADEIAKNPYLLARVRDLRFKQVDEVGLRLGVAADSQTRIQARIVDEIEGLARSWGHTAYPKSELVRRVSTSIEVTRSATEVGIEQLTRDRDELVEVTLDDKPLVAIGEYYRAESKIAADIMRLRETAEPLYGRDDPAISEIIARAPHALNELQKLAVFRGLTEPLSITTGGPGTGKTDISQLIILGALRKFSRAEVGLAAPTGRAAKVMSKIAPAMTLDRTLGLTARGYSYNERNKLDFRYFLGDEMGMASALTSRDLFSALACSFALLGDVHQLASVAPGNVLSDLINAGIKSGVIPVTVLRKNYRSDAESIIKGSEAILDGEMPAFDDQFAFHERFSDDSALDIISRAALKAVEILGSFEDVQVLSAQREGLLGTVHLNRVFQDVLNPQMAGKKQYEVGKNFFREGDRIIQTRNDYDRDFMNGDIGYIAALDSGRAYIRLDDSGRTVEIPRVALHTLEHAYAITIHKSQGGEYKHVLIPLSLDHRNMLNKNLLYTGVTRAKSRVSLVGSMEAMRYAVTTNMEYLRHSTLGQHLRAANPSEDLNEPKFARAFAL